MPSDEKEPDEEVLRLGKDPKPISGVPPEIRKGLDGASYLRKEMDERLDELRSFQPKAFLTGVDSFSSGILDEQRREAQERADRVEREKRQLAALEAQSGVLEAMLEEAPRSAKRQRWIMVAASVSAVVGVIGLLVALFR